MNDMTIAANDLTVAIAREIETAQRLQSQVPMPTHHVIHAGMYHRTIKIPMGVRLTSVMVVVPTTLVIFGSLLVLMGDTWTHFKGYQVLPASPNRKMAYYAMQDSYITMSYRTDKTTLAEIEAEFTSEPELLMSHSNLNTVIHGSTP